MRPIFAIEGVRWWKCREDGGDAFWLKSHVVVPFVVVLEGFDSVGGGVAGNEFKIGGPVWIHGPVSFKVSAHPVEKCFPGITFRDFDGVVYTDEADTLIHEFANLIEVRNDRMATSSVGEDDDGLGVVEEFGILGPEFGDFGFHGEPRFLVESICQEVNAVAPVVSVGAMAVSASDDGDLGFGVSGCREQGQEPEDVEEGFAYHNSIWFLENRLGSCFWDKLTSWLGDGDGSQLWWELVFQEGRKGQCCETVEGRTKVRFSIAAVDNDGDGNGIGSEFANDVECFLDSTAFGDNVFGYEDFFTWLEFEAASEGEVSVLFFKEDVAFAGLAGNFLANDESTHGWSDYSFKISVSDLFQGEFSHSGDGGHVLADLGTLEEMAAVQT